MHTGLTVAQKLKIQIKKNITLHETLQQPFKFTWNITANNDIYIKHYNNNSVSTSQLLVYTSTPHTCTDDVTTPFTSEIWQTDVKG